MISEWRIQIYDAQGINPEASNLVLTPDLEKEECLLFCFVVIGFQMSSNSLTFNFVLGPEGPKFSLRSALLLVILNELR